MTEVITFLAAPFLMCLVLVGIHCYLGLHVLARGVIFVDLSLAQVAALGTIVGYLFGFEHEDLMSYVVSLSATILAALFLSFANRFRDRVSQEAIIGILYAFASAFVILLVDKMSHGAEHLKYALVGQLLWVSWDDLLRVTVIYSGVAFVHWWFRRRFIESSMSPSSGQAWIWDFLFYALFGVVITSSVHVAGVLLVFAFLIVPAVLSSLWSNRMSSRLWFGWGLGFVLSMIGMALSYIWDMPAGALIVVVFTACPLLVVLLMPLLGKGKVVAARRRARSSDSASTVGSS